MITKLETILQNIIVNFQKKEDYIYFKKYSTVFLPYFIDKEKERKNIFIHILRDKNSSFFYKNQDTYIIKENSRTPSYRVGLDTLMLISSLIDVTNYKNQIYTFHGMFIGYHNKGALILGKSGSGKTTLYFEFLKNLKEKINFYYFDKVIIKNKKENFIVLGGTPTPLIRKGTLIEYNKKFDNFKRMNKNYGKWEEYYIFSISPTLVTPKKIGSLELKKIFFINRDNYDLETYKLSKEVSTLRIYENIHHFISNFPLYIIGLKQPLPIQNIPINIYKEAINFCENITSHFNVEFLSGNINQIVEYIWDNLK